MPRNKPKVEITPPGAQPWSMIRPPKEPAGVVRDYIPAGEELTRAEQARVDHHRRLGNYDFVQADYVPDPTDESATGGEVQLRSLTQAQRLERAEAHRREAEAAAIARSETGHAVSVTHAVAKLKGLNSAEAVDYIKTLPHRSRQIFIEAELESQARPDVLKHFKAEPLVYKTNDPALLKSYTKAVLDKQPELADVEVKTVETPAPSEEA